MQIHSNKINTILWLSLLALMFVNYWFAEKSGMYSLIILLIILAVIIIKFIGIGFIYMELKSAHINWKILFIGFIIFFSLIIGVIAI